MWTYLQVTPIHIAHLDTELVVEIGRDNSRSYNFPEKKDLHLHSLILSESFWRTASAKSIRVSRFQFLDFNAMFALAILIFGFQFLLAATKLIVTKLIVTGGHFQNLTAYEFSSNFQSLQPCKQCIQMLKSKEKLQSICKEALAF